MKQVSLSLPFSSAVMVAVVLIQFAVILAMTYQCRMAQERVEAYQGLMEKMVLIPRTETRAEQREYQRAERKLETILNAPHLHRP